MTSGGVEVTNGGYEETAGLAYPGYGPGKGLYGEALSEKQTDKGKFIHYSSPESVLAGKNASERGPVKKNAVRGLSQLKIETAQKLGIPIPQDGYYGLMASRDTGAIGGHMTRHLVQIAEQMLVESSGRKLNH